jgi:predicted DCC family thiol-disulfide oxidoreductase YuxK
MPENRLPVLLYDGDCRLCNGVVRFILRHDREGRLRFAPLQSAPAQGFLAARGLPATDFSSLVYVADWETRETAAVLLRTDGALAAFRDMGGPWARLAGLRVVPSFLRDAAYRLVARTRYAIFGRYQPGPLPDPAWEKRFLAR